MEERPAKVIFDPSQGPQKSVAAYSGEFGSLVVVLWLIMVANSAKQTCKVIFCLKWNHWFGGSSNQGVIETEKREFWSVQKLIEWVLVAISSCSIGPFSLQKFFTEDILYAFVLSPGFISENFVLSEIDVEKKQVNTGITRIFRQHQFIEFRN